MIYRGNPDYYPILERSRDLWAELEAETGQNILTRCGGLSIGTKDGPYIRSVLPSRTSSLFPAAGPNVSCPSTSRPQR